MLSLLNNIILILCNLAPDPPVSSVTKDQPQGGEGKGEGHSWYSNIGNTLAF